MDSASLIPLSLSSGSWFLIALVVFVAYVFVVAIYRIYFHPLSAYPGPVLAALSSLYEFYYDVILDGKFLFQRNRLHDIYGPIIRIRPNELHINDPEFYDQLYSRAGRRDKYSVQTQRLGYTNDMFSTVGHDLHRARRKSLSPFFSIQKIDDFQEVIREKVEHLCATISQYKDEQVLLLDRAWMALTTDIITGYAFAKPVGHLKSPNFQESFYESTQLITSAMQVGVHFPLLMPILDLIPEWIVQRLKPELQTSIRFKKGLIAQIKGIRAGTNEDHMSVTHPTIFHDLLLNSSIPLEEKTDIRLGDEALVLVSAGLATTAWALSVASFHITSNPQIFQKLYAELKASQFVSNMPLDRHKLEQLPYLNGCVHEGIRLSGGGVAVRLTRLAADSELQYGGWTIPRNTPVSMTNIDVLMNESIFHNPNEFLPERWVNDKELERFWVPFGKGTRSCLGMNLAYAEVYIALAAVFSQFQFELYKTDISDIELAHATQVPYPKRTSKGVRVLVKSADE